MGTARWQHTLTLLQNGQVLVTGGSATLAKSAAPTGSAEVYSQ
jgi:hypothetical protein